jgi:hypothetical protein
MTHESQVSFFIRMSLRILFGESLLEYSPENRALKSWWSPQTKSMDPVLVLLLEMPLGNKWLKI